MTRRLPVRWRLTLWYAALLAAALLLFGGGLYVVLRQRLHAGFDEQLLNQAALTLGGVEIRDGVPALAPAGPGVDDGEYFLRLLDAAGRPLQATGGDPVIVPLDPGDAAAALA